LPLRYHGRTVANGVSKGETENPASAGRRTRPKGSKGPKAKRRPERYAFSRSVRRRGRALHTKKGSFAPRRGNALSPVGRNPGAEGVTCL